MADPARRLAANAPGPLVVDGEEPVAFGDLTVIPTPGHTRGHCVLHHRSYLFSGDHLAWDRERERLSAHPDVCWYGWRTQLCSVAKLAAYEIEWLLPGHGARVRLDAAAMRRAIGDVVARG
ncbi:MAG TPA: hypothetical protein VK665_03975 [Candidatus Elarobacter sp.]|nr:hypothetical protein [Candidatus Elarobacter sp.]